MFDSYKLSANDEEDMEDFQDYDDEEHPAKLDDFDDEDDEDEEEEIVVIAAVEVPASMPAPAAPPAFSRFGTAPSPSCGSGRQSTPRRPGGWWRRPVPSALAGRADDRPGPA